MADVFLAARRHSLPYLRVVRTPDEVRRHFAGEVFENGQIFVAELKAREIIGFIAFDREFVHHLYVHPDAQGKGVGRGLLSVALERSERLKLWTFERNERARRFYERNGFRVLTRTDGSGNEEKELDVLMEWRR